MNPILHIFYAALGSLGFCFFLHVDKKHFLPCTLNGAAAWGIFLLINQLSGLLFVGNAVAALFAAIVAEILSRKLKAPAVIFYIPGIVPLVPGSTLYYMMEALVQNNYALAGEKAIALMWTLLGIGVGCALTIACIGVVQRIKK